MDFHASLKRMSEEAPVDLPFAEAEADVDASDASDLVSKRHDMLRLGKRSQKAKQVKRRNWKTRGKWVQNTSDWAS